MGVLQRFTEIIDWYPKDMSKEERKLVNKIDWLVLSFSCLSYFTKNLDVSALTNAYVAGMDVDLDLYGDRFSYANSMYYVGYCLFQIPSNIVLTRLRAEWYLPAAEVLWGIFTLGTAFIKNYKQLMVLRFFVGFSSTACWVGNAHIVNSWYTSQELGKRNAIYSCVWPLGSMFAGYLQSAAYNNLNNTGGLAGWRWLFIICAIITIPISLIGVIFCPNVPDRTHSRFLNERERELCVSRLAKDGFGKSRGVDRTLIKRIFGNWRIYVLFVVGNLFWMTPYPSGIPYTLWLDSNPKYGVSMVNNLSTITYAAQIVSNMVSGWYSDYRRNRWEPMLYGGILILVCNVMLLVWKIPNGAKFFAFIGLGVANGPTNLCVPWIAEVFSHDVEARSAAIAILNVGWVVINLVVPLVAWPTSAAPEFKGGYIWSVVMSVIQMILLPVPVYLLRREKRMGIDYHKKSWADVEDEVVLEGINVSDQGSESGNQTASAITPPSYKEDAEKMSASGESDSVDTLKKDQVEVSVKAD